MTTIVLLTLVYVITNFFNLKPSNVLCWFVKMISIALEYVVMFLLDLATISVIFVTSCILAHIINVYDLSEVCLVCWRVVNMVNLDRCFSCT